MNRCTLCKFGVEEYRAIGNKPEHAHLCLPCWEKMEEDQEHYVRHSVSDHVRELLEHAPPDEPAVRQIAELKAAGSGATLRVTWMTLNGRYVYRYGVRHADQRIDSVVGPWRDMKTHQPVPMSEADIPAAVSTVPERHSRLEMNSRYGKGPDLPSKKELEELTGRKAVNLPADVWMRQDHEVGWTALAVLHRPGEDPWALAISLNVVLLELARIDPGLPPHLRQAQAVRSLIIRLAKEHGQEHGR
jgi:hypothetical protein